MQGASEGLEQFEQNRTTEQRRAYEIRAGLACRALVRPAERDTGVMAPGQVSAGEPCVSLVPLFAGLTREQQADVATLARPVTVGTGETFVRAGARQAPRFVVHSGMGEALAHDRRRQEHDPADPRPGRGGRGDVAPHG
jgi:hypothetical protein